MNTSRRGSRSGWLSSQAQPTRGDVRALLLGGVANALKLIPWRFEDNRLHRAGPDRQVDLFQQRLMLGEWTMSGDEWGRSFLAMQERGRALDPTSRP